ncbi:PAS domain-containing sensor histidine kinase [Salarchaeum sp. JOR-1]|uniref:sensor histidine kinase n=1 Tax=Salarchaeum sp. JOR-1 TaxID=2599399 RepID=UPI00143DBF53|nr:PAS domain S-box protein [Salarchaeum sp. JOR-1]
MQQTAVSSTLSPLFLLSMFIVDLLVIGALFVLLDRHIVAPIQQLTADTGAIARGEFDQSITVFDTDDELGALSHSLHEMHDQLMTTIQEAQQFEQAIEHAGHAIYITDTDGTIEYVNPAFEEITGYSEDQALGETPRILNSGRQSETYYEELWETIRSGEVWEDNEFMNQRATGELFVADQTIAPITDGDGNVVKFVAIMNDRTGEVISQQQTQVLSRVVRHNLRTDLNLIDGYAHQITKTDDTEAQTDYVHDLRERVEGLVELSQKAYRAIQEFDRGTYRQSQSVCTTCDRVVTGIAEQYPQANLTTDLPDYEIDVRANVELVFEELVENAIEHNDQATPEVTIRVTRTDEGDSSPMIQVVIVDNGPGLPDSEQEVLDAGEETALTHGSGIGLWVVHWTVTYAGGEVTIEDRSPRGTRVTVTLPRASVRTFPRDATTDDETDPSQSAADTEHTEDVDQ